MFVRYLDTKKNIISYGVLKKENNLIHPISGDLFSDYQIGESVVNIDDVKLLAPVNPSKVVAVGLNYKDHAGEVNLAIPEKPMLFIKPSTTVIGDNDAIIYPDETNQLEFEAELGIIVKKETKNISENQVASHILGYTCANDVTARDIQFSDSILTHLTWAKTYDTFCPLGPGIVEMELDQVANLDISLYLNGEKKQHSNTKNLIFSVPYLVSFISKIMTLNPGDVIITGTPHGIGEMHKGDDVEVEIEGIGKLTNRIQ